MRGGGRRGLFGREAMSCCGDQACSHAVIAAATAEATRLTDSEREIILEVLGRDELIRRDQRMQVMHLKGELQSLRRKGALKPSGQSDSAGSDPDRACGRCRAVLGRVINRGACCRACRLRVCKGCREYSFKATDWVCIVCHKHMEIQATSGEWMNEFVRRPSRRRENLPAADIIKRTIRRSWTISNPTPRWAGLRSSSELRPYNSLPHGQVVDDYPSLALHRTNLVNQQLSLESAKIPPIHRKLSPARRAQSEEAASLEEPQSRISPQRQTRVNPLMRLADQKTAQKRSGQSDEASSEGSSSKEEGSAHKDIPIGEPDDSEAATTNELNYAREETAPAPDPVELCDIEPISGTVFRKVTVRRRRQLSSSEGGWRRGHQDVDLLDVFPPDGDDYKLVFINTSDGSSKEETSSSKEEEDDDEDDSNSTASSFPLDECDWDYFEPGAGPGGAGRAHSLVGWAPSPFGSPGAGRRATLESPFGSPIVYRRLLRESDPGTDEDTPRHLDAASPASSSEEAAASSALRCAHDVPPPRRRPCRHCGSPARYIPVPVPVPVPFPVCPLPLLALLWRARDQDGAPPEPPPRETEEPPPGAAEDPPPADDSSGDWSSDSEGTDGRFSRVFVVNGGGDSDADECAVVLTGVRRLGEGEEEGAEGESAPIAARYTSLVMITQEAGEYRQQVSVVTSDTTTLVPDVDDVVVVRHTNRQLEREKDGETNDNRNHDAQSVTVITGGDTLSAFEEGLADDDSWVENLSHDDDDDDHEEDEFATNSSENSSSSGDEVTLTCSAAIDQEEDLRGYHRSAIDFTLHTIVEESCEESEVEQHKDRPLSTTDLEKYFFFGLGDGSAPSKEDAFSETSSIYSEAADSLAGPEDDDDPDPAELASSRLEKYFLSGFMGFTAERRDSDGSVGSDSEGRPSPEQRRKRLVRARGTGRSHSSSLDNLDNAGNEQAGNEDEDGSSSSESEPHDEAGFEKPDGDTVKRKKGKKQKTSPDENESEEGRKTPQNEGAATTTTPSNLTTATNQQSRDSGFVGSCDDLVKEQRDNGTPELPNNKNELDDIAEEEKKAVAAASTPPATSLTRKDSFNNWSSDEETNLMMCKMRQFFKTMVANSQPKPVAPMPVPSPRAKRCKPPQLVYFENELTRLMKSVPGIREDQVREIVEYLSSEDAWSDSYDSSDYTSSDLEATTSKSALQQQISDSCKQIINKFDATADDEGDEGDGGIVDEAHGPSTDTAVVYQKLVASFEKMATGELADEAARGSPPLIAKVMHHIGSRLVALMHEVSGGESHASASPRAKHYHRRLQHKLSSASSTATEDDFADDAAVNVLPRSRSHDPLTTAADDRRATQPCDNAEEREASDCERFSWRGSFESALLAADSRNKLSLLGHEGVSASALALAAKRRSAGDLLFSHKSPSREQLDRVRSCGSIAGAGGGEDKLWVVSRRSSAPDRSDGSADGEEEEEDEELECRATLPRSLQSAAASTNSLPRLPTGGMQKSQSMQQFSPQNVKSARYRPPGFSRLTTAPKRAVSAPGLQPSHQRRGRRSQQASVPSDESSTLSEAQSSPMLATRSGGGQSATPSPVAPAARRNASSTAPVGQEWHQDEDIDRLVGLHARTSLSSLGLRSDSMASVYSGAGEGRYGTVAVRGHIEFGLQYNYKAGDLEIQIKQCKDLAPVDAKRNRSDPYVKVYLLPDKSKSGKRKTKVKKHTLNPVFDECLKFRISLNGLETRTLWLTVWHSDMFGRNDFLGEVMMTLENKVFDDPIPKCYNLQERTEPFEDIPTYKGDVLVCLKFVPPDMTVQKKGKRSRGALHVLVKEAKSLTAVKAHGTSDPFCKSYLLPDKGRNSKQKTPVARKTVNPVWNYKFVYEDVTLQELAERCLELTVWDHDRLASNEFLGGVRFSLGTGKHYGKGVDWMDATGRELSLWKNMLERPNFWVEGCLPLRPSLDTRVS